MFLSPPLRPPWVLAAGKQGVLWGTLYPRVVEPFCDHVQTEMEDLEFIQHPALELGALVSPSETPDDAEANKDDGHSCRYRDDEDGLTDTESAQLPTSLPGF